MRKGFTLIELLAVIIILAIIALIATPIILNVIDDSKKSAGLSETNMIYSGINNYCAASSMKNELDGSSDICADGVTTGEVGNMVNLGKASVSKVTYSGGKVTELEVTSNGHIFKLCGDGSFVVDDEVCTITPSEPEETTQNYALLTTGTEFYQIVFDGHGIYGDSTIIFSQDKAPDGVIVKDVSATGDMSVVTWNINDNTYVISTQDENTKIRLNEDSSNMIDINGNYIEISGFDLVDTSQVKNLTRFLTDGQINNADFSNLNLTNVQTLSGTFEAVTFAGESTNLSGWNLNNVDSVAEMFKNAEFGANYIDLSGWTFPLSGLDQLFANSSIYTDVLVNEAEYSVWNEALAASGNFYGNLITKESMS